AGVMLLPRIVEPASGGGGEGVGFRAGNHVERGCRASGKLGHRLSLRLGPSRAVSFAAPLRLPASRIAPEIDGLDREGGRLELRHSSFTPIAGRAILYANPVHALG